MQGIPLLVWLLQPAGLWTAFAWGFAESSFFFLVPDVLLTLVALFAPRKAFAACLVALAGALIAGAGLYSFARSNPVTAKKLVMSVPFVREWMWSQVEQDYRSLGWRAPQRGPRAGIPYKLYAVQASGHLGFAEFLFISIPARLGRFLLTAGVCALIGYLLGDLIARHPVATLVLHGLGWTVFYIGYWSRI